MNGISGSPLSRYGKVVARTNGNAKPMQFGDDVKPMQFGDRPVTAPQGPIASPKRTSLGLNGKAMAETPNLGPNDSSPSSSVPPLSPPSPDKSPMSQISKSSVAGEPHRRPQYGKAVSTLLAKQDTRQWSSPTSDRATAFAALGSNISAKQTQEPQVQSARGSASTSRTPMGPNYFNAVAEIGWGKPGDADNLSRPSTAPFGSPNAPSMYSKASKWLKSDSESVSTSAPSTSHVSPKSSREVSQRVTLNLDGKEELFCVRFSPDSEYIAASFGDGSICVCTARNGKQITRLNVQPGNQSLAFPTTMLRWRPQRVGEESTSDRLIGVTSDGSIMCFNALSRKRIFDIKENGNHLLCCEYAPEGYQFATAGKVTEIHVYDESTQKEISCMRGGDVKHTMGHSNRIFSMKYVPTMPQVIVSGSWDKLLQFWDTRVGNAVRQILGPYICGDSVDVSFNGDTVLTGSSRGKNQLQLWDFGTGKLLDTIPWRARDPCHVLAAQFSKHDSSNTVVAGGSNTNEVKLFDGLCEWNNFGYADVGNDTACYANDFSHDGSMLVVAGSSGFARVLNLE